MATKKKYCDNHHVYNHCNSCLIMLWSSALLHHILMQSVFHHVVIFKNTYPQVDSSSSEFLYMSWIRLFFKARLLSMCHVPVDVAPGIPRVHNLRCLPQHAWGWTVPARARQVSWETWLWWGEAGTWAPLTLLTVLTILEIVFFH